MTPNITTPRIRKRIHLAVVAFAIIGAMGALHVGESIVAPSVNAQTALKSIIGELRGDPVVVAKARAQAAGQSFNEAAYRRQVIAEQQQQFLTRLTLAGVPYTISSVTAPNGPVTPNIQFRYNYVFNGIVLDVHEQTLPIFSRVQDVLAVFPKDFATLLERPNAHFGFRAKTPRKEAPQRRKSPAQEVALIEDPCFY